MKKDEAEHLISHLTQCGFNAGLGYEQWPDGWGNWYVLVETKEGHLYHLLTPEAVAHFIEHDGPEEIKETKKMQRYLECRVCGQRFSAVPEHYVGWEGYLSHCGRALKLCHRNPIDGAEYTIGELVDWEYLRRGHSDEYAPHQALTYHASQLYQGLAAETTQGTPPKPPRIPEALQQPVEKPDYGLLGLMLYHAGYRRLPEGEWRRTFSGVLSAADDYHPFQEGDRIHFEPEELVHFQVLQTHRSPNYWGVRFKEEQAA
jgi:hypothetical protein